MIKRRNISKILASTPFLLAFKPAEAAMIKPERVADPYLIIPTFLDEPQVIIHRHTKTYIYKHMCRWNLATDTIEKTSTDDPIYQTWIEDQSQWRHGIPPHICFGGITKVGEKDFMPFEEWRQHTIQLLKEGKLK